MKAVLEFTDLVGKFFFLRGIMRIGCINMRKSQPIIDGVYYFAL